MDTPARISPTSAQSPSGPAPVQHLVGSNAASFGAVSSDPAGSSTPTSSPRVTAASLPQPQCDPRARGQPAGGQDPSASLVPSGSDPPESSAARAPMSNDAALVAAAPTPPFKLASTRPFTRCQHGIHKPKQYTDGTVRWGMMATFETGEPTTLTEALKDPKWIEAMNHEYNALLQNKTWHLVPPPKGKNIIDSKWVYKIKRKVDGTNDRYKAWLVAK